MDDATKNYLDEKFAMVDQRFEAASATQSDILTLVDKRFDAVDQRFNQVDARLDSIEEKLGSTMNQVSGHEKRLTFLEERVLH